MTLAPDPLPSDPDEAGPLPPLPQPPTTQVHPLCPHFGPCGGCQLQNIPYPAQLAHKRNILLNLLRDLDPPPLHLHSAEPWLYRNRIRLRLEPSPGSPNHFTLGYNLGQTNDFLPIQTCPISAPILLRAAQTLTSLAASDPNTARWLEATAQLELFTLPDETALQLTLLLHATPDPKHTPPHNLQRSLNLLAEALQERLPQLAGLGADLLPLRPNTPHTQSRRPLPPLAWGRPGLAYPVHLSPKSTPTPLWVSRNSFFQINRHLLPTLVHTALSAAQPQYHQPLAWDLFAGVGLFARALAPHFDRITAVESSPASAADLRSAHVPNIEVIQSTTLAFLRQASISRDRPSLVLLDPPRAGLGLDASTLLARLHPPRIIYISCDPASLARDLRPMLSSGYILAELHLLDMFPQTTHLETIAVLDHPPSQQPRA